MQCGPRRALCSSEQITGAVGGEWQFAFQLARKSKRCYNFMQPRCAHTLMILLCSFCKMGIITVREEQEQESGLLLKGSSEGDSKAGRRVSHQQDGAPWQVSKSRRGSQLKAND